MNSTILQLVAAGVFASAAVADTVEAEFKKTQRERMGLVRIVGTLNGVSGFPWTIVVVPGSDRYLAEVVELRRQARDSDLLGGKYKGLTVEVIGYYNSFRNHERNRDVTIGEVTIVKSWRVVEPASPRGVWQLFNGQRIFPPKIRPELDPIPTLHIPGLLED